MLNATVTVWVWGWLISISLPAAVMFILGYLTGGGSEATRVAEIQSRADRINVSRQAWDRMVIDKNLFGRMYMEQREATKAAHKGIARLRNRIKRMTAAHDGQQHTQEGL